MATLYDHGILVDFLQAYYVIKAAQEREELQREGDILDGRIQTAEREVRGLEASLAKLNLVNADMGKSFRYAVPLLHAQLLQNTFSPHSPVHIPTRLLAPSFCAHTACHMYIWLIHSFSECCPEKHSLKCNTQLHNQHAAELDADMLVCRWAQLE